MRLLPLLFLLAACDRSPPSRPLGPDAPPNGRGRYTDDQGQDHTLFRPLGVIKYGDERKGSVPDPPVLLGYEFEARSGAMPVISLTIPRGRRAGVALYGPRGIEGLWDSALASSVGENALTLSGITLDLSGMYFILLRGLDQGELNYTLRLRCEGEACGAPDCPDIDACDLVCPTRYAADELGCRLCACEVAACEEDCAEGQRCVAGQCEEIPCAERCPDGQDPVCGADGQTWRNACTAECAGVLVVSRGPCAPMDECDERRRCAEGQLCREGRCMRDDCGCDLVRTPVCSTEGETFANRCLLECRGAIPEHPGPCVEDACRGTEDCAEDERCEPVPEPENRRRCQRDPESPECLRHCIPDEGMPCGPGGPICRAEQMCVQLSGLERPGFCTEACNPERGCPMEDQVCVSLPDRPEVGACLPACSAENPRCPEGLFCQPDEERRFACRPFGCGCPPPRPEEGVCADGVEQPSSCLARCAGARNIVPGPCAEQPPECICPGDRRPLVCGGDGTFYADACDAACARQQAARPVTCLGDTPITCREDIDCMVTGCEGRVCAAAVSEVCPEYSPAAACRVELGPCACFKAPGQETGTCSFQLNEAAFRCAQGARDREPQPPP